MTVLFEELKEKLERLDEVSLLELFQGHSGAVRTETDSGLALLIDDEPANEPPMAADRTLPTAQNDLAAAFAPMERNE